MTLDEQLAAVLDDYATDLREAVNTVTEVAANKLKKAIAADAPVKTGKQKKSWKISKEYLGGIDLKTVVHSSDYRKVHLLNNGHVVRDGTTRRGRLPTKGTQYVTKNAEKILNEYEANLAEAIKVVK